MGFSCLISEINRSVPKLMTASQILNLLLFAHLRHILSLIPAKSISIYSFMINSHEDHMMMPFNHGDDLGENRPNPASLMPVSVHLLAEAMKKQLPVVPYRSFLEKIGSVGGGGGGKLVMKEKEDCVCIVCLNRIELSHEVRLPFNCSHVFHRECLDVWVDQGHGTCPLCRSKLLPILTQNHDDDHHHHQAGDPWRRERMVYLFGEDYLFGDDDE